ncbi:hypothetical protein [Demequina rhizosphaerae]|uniref:hypothetical protein n=1 Tax=Demequina rhizosphaerae TaxID=1638985 RepID=UPI000AB0308F|nr:hypothetical protein [Demequina rhizosphaerae]
MSPRPRPLLGMVLGLLLGLVTVGLLWQLGVIDPGRTVLFGVSALAVMLVAGLLTRDASRARGRYTAVVAIAGVLGGVALTGIGELVRPGSISDGCTVEASVGDTVVAPENTAALTPLVVPADGVVTWTAGSETPVAVTERVAGVVIGGFEIPIRTVTSAGAPEAQEMSGEVVVADALTWITDRSWLEPTGVYHAYGTMAGGSVRCELDGYVKVAPAGVFSTNTLTILWISLGVLLLLIAWAAFAVRRSFTRADQDEARALEAAAAGFAAGEGAHASNGDGAPVDYIDPVPAWRPDDQAPAGGADEIVAPPAEEAVQRRSAFAAPNDDASGDGSGGGSQGADDSVAAWVAGEPAMEGGDDDLLTEGLEDADAEEPVDAEAEPADAEVEDESEAEPEPEETEGEPEEAEPEPEETEGEPEEAEPVAEGEGPDEDAERIVPADGEDADAPVEDEPRADDAAADDDGADNDEGPEAPSEDEDSGPKP